MVNQFDSNAYVWAAQGDLFFSVFQAAGYSEWLRLTHLVTDDAAFTAYTQHAMGLATAWLLWWVVRRASGSPWLGLIPAAFVAFDADMLLLEHSVMSETLFRLLVVGVLALALRALDARRPWTWMLAAGLVTGAAIWVRFAGLVLVPVLALWTVVALWRPFRRSLPAAAAVLASALLVLAAYAVLQGRQNGYYGLGESGGWALYARTAGFADCTQFTPPPGTERLCQTGPPESRPPPDWYAYSRRSPANIIFGGQPIGDKQLGQWSRRAIAAMPRQYLAEVGRDLAAYVSPPAYANTDYALIGPFTVSFRLRTPDGMCAPRECRPPPLDLEGASQRGQREWFEPYAPSYHAGYGFFQDYQRSFRVHGWLVALLSLVALAGAVAARGRLRAGQWLTAAFAFALLVFPVATATYNVRYGVVTYPILAAAAALAIPALARAARAAGAVARRGGSRSPRTLPEGSPAPAPPRSAAR